MIVHIKINTHIGTFLVSLISRGTPKTVTNINTAYSQYIDKESNPEKYVDNVCAHVTNPRTCENSRQQFALCRALNFSKTEPFPKSFVKYLYWPNTLKELSSNVSMIFCSTIFITVT